MIDAIARRVIELMREHLTFFFAAFFFSAGGWADTSASRG